MIEVTLGVDIGGTNTAFGAVDRDGHCHAHGQIATATHPKFETFVHDLCDGVRRCLAQIDGEHRMHAAGIGAPNGNYYRGTVEDAPNLPWKGVLPLAMHVRRELGQPTWVTNDANAAVIGEHLYGRGKGKNHLLVVTLGTGVGSGFLVDGKVLYGHTGFAGELGHVIVQPDGRQCGCGRRGCLETYASVTGFVDTAREKMAQTDVPSSLRQLSEEELTGKAIHDAARDGDALARAVYEDTGEMLGLALANTAQITSPELIILFGGLAESRELILEPTQRAMDRFILENFRGIELFISDLQDENAGILGAAALAWNEWENRNA